MIGEFLIGLVGAVVGAYLVRHQQHQKWLLERGSEAFARFLESITIARGKVSELLTIQPLPPDIRRCMALTRAYQPVFDHARIARLYLPKPMRSEFSELVQRYWALHTDPELGDSRLTRMDESLDCIQEIFEEGLSPHAWLLGSMSWAKRRFWRRR